MLDLPAGPLKAGAQRLPLFLLFSLGVDRYALAAREVAAVLPRVPLKQIAGVPAWVAGVFAYRGSLVPVIDLSALSFGQPAVARTSTRTVLVHYLSPLDGRSHRLGLILEQATDTLRCDPDAFRDYGLDNQDARYLGPVFESPQGLVQRISVDELLPETVQALLFPPAAAAPAEGGL